MHAQVERTRELLDRVMAAGLDHRVGHRLGALDRHVFGELRGMGASAPGGGVAVCVDCARVFRPARKSTAKRCDPCHRRPAPRWAITDDRYEWPRMRFSEEATFVGWATRRFVKCHECGQHFEASRGDALLCSSTCRSDRKRRRDDGDRDELGPAARALRDELERIRGCWPGPARERGFAG